MSTRAPHQQQSVFAPARRTFLRLLCVLALSLGAARPLPAPAQESEPRDVAVVAHPGVPKSELTFSEVRRIFLGDVQYWDQSGTRVTLLIRAPEARERKVLLERVYEMSENQFRQYWIGKLFRGEVPVGPKIVYTSEMAAQLATAIPGSITFMEPAAVPSGLKVLKVDGLLPGEPGYPIR